MINNRRCEQHLDGELMVTCAINFAMICQIIRPRGYAEISYKGARDICFWRSANDKNNAQNCAGISSVDLF